MALEDIMDRIATTAATGLASADATTGLPGLKACFSSAASASPSSLIPRSVDDWPVAFVMPGGGDVQASNYETLLHEIRLDIWVGAADIAYAVRTITPFVDRARVLFRADLDMGATCQRCLMTGYEPLEPDTAHGKPFLVLPIRLEALELAVGGALYST